MAIQNGGKEGPSAEYEVEGSRRGILVFLIRLNLIKFNEFLNGLIGVSLIRVGSSGGAAH